MKLTNLKTESMKLRMTADEKSAMKRAVFGVQSNLAPQPSSYFSAFEFLHTRVLVPAFAFLLVFGGAATAAAAQGTLPGDLLYPVKVSVNEAVEVALATTPIAKAEVSQKLAERRVEEAETLAAQGKLDPEVGAQLAANFDQHASNAAALTDEVETQDPAAAQSLRTTLDSTLQAHGAILATLTEGGSKENQSGVGAVAARVLARADAAAPRATAAASRAAKVAAPAAKQSGAGQAVTMSLAVGVASGTATATPDVGAEASDTALLDDADAPEPDDVKNQKSAVELRGRAQAAIDDARGQFDDDKDGLENSATQISGEFAAIDELMELASTTLATGHYDEASGDYTDALKRATRLGVLIRVQAKLNQNIIAPILEKGDGDSFEVPVVNGLLSD